MSDEKIKTAAGKVPLGMVPLYALKGMARVLQHGGVRYEAGNYYLATLADGAGERYVSAMLRHLAEMQDPDGQWRKNLAHIDEESGLPEIDHILAGLLIERIIMIKEGLLPADPGMSKIVQAAQEAQTQPPEPAQPSAWVNSYLGTNPSRANYYAALGKTPPKTPEDPEPPEPTQRRVTARDDYDHGPDFNDNVNHAGLPLRGSPIKKDD